MANDTGGHDIANGGTLTGVDNLVMTSAGVPSGVIAIAANPELLPLQSNGGPTPTQALQAASPAIGAGNPADAPATDQRGFSRIAGTTIDIGAYEYGAPVEVTSTADSGAGSLRSALVLAETLPGSTVSFAPSLAGQTITLLSPLVITGNLTVNGSAAPGLILSGGGTTEVFNIPSGVTATLTGLTIENGLAATGGAISNAGTLTVTNSQFINDKAQGPAAAGTGGTGQGGAIYNAPGAELFVNDSTFTGDSAIGGAGQGVIIVGGTGQGGAIDNAAGATLSASDDTFTADVATGGGGGRVWLRARAALGGAILNSGLASLVSVTIDGNVVKSGVGTYPKLRRPMARASTMFSGWPLLDLYNSIVAEDTGGHDIANAGSVEGGSNLVATSTGLTGNITISTANPQLTPLANTGGPTPTQVPLTGSPAISTGSNALLASTATAIPGLTDLWLGNGNAQDSAGTSNGTVNGGVTYAPGLSGQAFQFNGTSAYVAIPPSADIVGTGGFAISVWIKTTAANGNIIQQRDAGNFNGEYVLLLAGGKVNFWVYGNSEYDVNMTSNASVNDGNWHNIVAVREPNGTGEIFIDGKLDSTQSGPDTPVGSNVNVYIGADEPQSPASARRPNYLLRADRERGRSSIGPPCPRRTCR